MKEVLFYLIVSLSLFLTGCQTSQNELCWSPKVPEHLLPCPVGEIPIKNEAHVLLPATVKAYAINRYVDPADPRIMHERHVLYRMEEDPHWKLAVNSKRQVLIGNIYSDSKLNYNPALMNKELALELQRQRLINAGLTSQSGMLIETGIHLSEQCNILKQQNTELVDGMQ